MDSNIRRRKREMVGGGERKTSLMFLEMSTGEISNVSRNQVELR